MASAAAYRSAGSAPNAGARRSNFRLSCTVSRLQFVSAWRPPGPARLHLRDPDGKPPPAVRAAHQLIAVPAERVHHALAVEVVEPEGVADGRRAITVDGDERIGDQVLVKAPRRPGVPGRERRQLLRAAVAAYAVRGPDAALADHIVRRRREAVDPVGLRAVVQGVPVPVQRGQHVAFGLERLEAADE